MNLLIKGFPDNLADQLKQEALRLKVSLKDLVIKKCSDVALRDSEKSTPKLIKPGSMLRVEGVKAPEPMKYMGPPHSPTCHCTICKIKRGDI